MAFSDGSASYYINSGRISGSGLSQTTGLHARPGFRPMAESNVRVGSLGSTFPIEPSQANFSSGLPSSEPIKRKRGRHRKYAAEDGPVALGLSSLSGNSKPTPDSNPIPRKARGRPPGSGRKQQLSLLGEWMNNSAGMAFAPHIIQVEEGEDVVGKILSFSEKKPRALCILSGNGTVSSVTLRQPASRAVGLTYEGRFQILCLSGSYLVGEDGPEIRRGGVSISLSTPDGQVIGGGVAMLTAAGPVQVVVCSFGFGSRRAKKKQVGGSKDNNNTLTQPYTSPGAGFWHNSCQVELQNPHSGIDLMRG